MPNPLTAGLKYGIPTIGSLGITTANQIGILFNATEPGGNSANVTDLTLKFYTATGSLLSAAIDWVITLSVDSARQRGRRFCIRRVVGCRQPLVNGLLANGPTTTLALENPAIARCRWAAPDPI